MLRMGTSRMSIPPFVKMVLSFFKGETERIKETLLNPPNPPL